MRPARFFYGYVILTLCFLNMFLMRGVLSSFAVFYVALLGVFGWSHATAASIASVNALVYALSSPLAGIAFDRLGPRILMPIAGLLICIGLFFSGRSRALWEFYLYYGLFVGLGLGGLGFVANTALISSWFQRRRGTALGLAIMGAGFGVLVVVPFIQILISRFGWESAFTLSAGVILFTTVPLNALLQRRRPADVGQLPDGAHTRAPEEGHHAGKTRVVHQWTVRDSIASFPFWAITAGHLVLGTGVSLMYTHVVAHLVKLGLDKLTAAFAFGLMGLARIPGTVLWGFLSDRLGRDTTYGFATLITLTGIGLFIAQDAGSSLWLVYAAVLLYGLGHSAGSPTYGATIADIFGGRTFGTIIGFLEISFGAGMAFGPWFGGFVYDFTSSYRWAFIVVFAAFLFSFLSVYKSLAWHRRYQIRRQALEPAQ